jgi:AraC-like DNA-binding protein
MTLGHKIMISGHMNKVTEIHESEYSEWKHDPQLLTRAWRHDPAKPQRSTTKPFKLHSHFRGQLLCVESGLIQVKTDTGSWILPPQRAGWIPPGASHSVYMSNGLSGVSLLFTPSKCMTLPNLPCVIGVSEVLRALIKRTSNWNKTDTLMKEQIHIVQVIIDEIKNSPHESLFLPVPIDPRLVRITQAILDAPASKLNTEQWASIGAMSERTLRRQMRSETGMSFNEWRQQAQLSVGLEMLANGISVSDTSYTLGYNTPSNFIAMFRRVFGDSPAHYFSNK